MPLPPLNLMVLPLARFQDWLPPMANGAANVKFRVEVSSRPTPLTPLRVKMFAAVASLMLTSPPGLAIMISPILYGAPSDTVLAAVTVLSHLPMSPLPGAPATVQLPLVGSAVVLLALM